MKITLATGIFYPDVGGPAIHVRKIAEKLVEEGFNVQVIAFGDDTENKQFDFKVERISRRLPKVLQWYVYLLKVVLHAANSKLVYAFDPTTAGMSAGLAGFIFWKPFIIRIGGDLLWEREAERGKRLMPVAEYYEQGLAKRDKPFLYFMIKFLLKRAERVIVPNQFLKDLYIQYYGVKEKKAEIIENPAFKRESALHALPNEPTVLFAGRFVSYKNLPRVISALEHIKKSMPNVKLMLVGAGPDKEKLEELVRSKELVGSAIFKNAMPQEELFELIKESAICIGPALTEFNPNFILEALSFGKPVLLSRSNGLSVDLPEEFLFDPLDEKELKAKLEALLKKENYAEAVQKVNNLPLEQSWDEVTGAHLSLIRELTS